MGEGPLSDEPVTDTDHDGSLSWKDALSWKDSLSRKDALSWKDSLSWKDALSLGIVAFVLLLPVVGLMRYQGPPMEEGFMLVFPERMLHGDLPHRDFLHLYGPGSLWVLAAVYKLFGATITVERLVGLAQHAAVAFGMLALLRPWGRRISTAGAVTAILILIGPLGLSAMAWNGALAAAVCSLAVGAAGLRRAAAGRPSTALLATSGVLAGVSLLYRPDLILAVGLGTVALYVTVPRGRRRPLVLGAVGALALYIPHVVTSGIPASIQGMFLEPVFELRAGRSLPVPPSFGEVDGFLQRAGSLRVTGWPLPMLPVSVQIFTWFMLVPLSIAVVLYAAWRLRRARPGTDRATSYWPAALFCAGLLQQAIQRPDTAHLSWVTGISFPLLIAAVAWLVEAARPAWSPVRTSSAGIAVVAVLLVGVVPFYPVRTYADLVSQTFGFNRFGFPITHDGRTFYFGSAEGADDAQAIVDELAERSRPGERLMVGPRDLSRANYSDAFFYNLFPDLTPGTQFIEMDPGIADAEGSPLASELKDNDWLILSDAWNDWSEPNTSSESRSQAANRVVEDRYCTVRETPTFTLLQRCR